MKRIKMMLYGEPGVGKSVFACRMPNPFFITTDGNYEWLEEFGAKEKDHIQVNSWAEAKKAFDLNFDGYDTIVVDLLEDLFKWCEFEFCEEKKIDHIGDLGYGKGYDITRNEFFIQICKLINKDKNVIFLSHEETRVTKDRRGIEKYYHKPSARIPDKVLDMIEGRLRYVVRCYLKAEDGGDGSEKIYKRRYLSLIPKENEYGIVRGINENNLPSDIPLDAHLFLETIGFEKNSLDKKNEDKELKVAKNTEPDIKPVETTTPETPKTPEVKKTKAKTIDKQKAESIKVINVNPEALTTDTVENVMKALNDSRNVLTKASEIKVESQVEPKVESKAEPVNQDTNAKPTAPAQPNEDKIAEIKRKIEMLRKQRGENK